MASGSNGGQTEPSVKSGTSKFSLEDIKKMPCNKLIEALTEEIPDDFYKADLQILKDEGIDGNLFLDLPYDPDLKEVFDKLSGGGKAKIRKVVRGIKGQADSCRKPVEQDLPQCTTQTPDDMVKGSGNEIAATDGDMQRAWIPPDAVWPWKDKNEISVDFLYRERQAEWTIGDGEPMNKDTILLHANTWSNMGGGKIPRFVEAQNGSQAQIRVSFNNDKIRNSSLGKRAQSIQAPKPTMNLDLHNGCPSDDHKKHVIIHEFGHALGLGHEHQRSDFWKCIKPFINIEKMKEDLGVTDEQFAKDWKEIVDSEAGRRTKEYDPKSIMHYLFKVEWLTRGYSDKKKVKEDLEHGILGEKAANALLGIHQRCGFLPVEPSDPDIQLLREVYGGDVGVPEQDGAEKQKYDVEVTGAYLSRMEWIENGQLKVVSIYEEASYKWLQIGQTLGLNEGVLDGIGQDGCTVRVKLTKVLGKWQEDARHLPRADQYPKSWSGLINLLNKSGLGELAQRVHEALLQQKQP